MSRFKKEEENKKKKNTINEGNPVERTLWHYVRGARKGPGIIPQDVPNVVGREYTGSVACYTFSVCSVSVVRVCPWQDQYVILGPPIHRRSIHG